METLLKAKRMLTPDIGGMASIAEVGDRTVSSRVEYGIDNTTTQFQNIQSAESVIRDADMAQEIILYTSN